MTTPWTPVTDEQIRAALDRTLTRSLDDYDPDTRADVLDQLVPAVRALIDEATEYVQEQADYLAMGDDL